jgi:hypothetical protein
VGEIAGGKAIDNGVDSLLEPRGGEASQGTAGDGGEDIATEEYEQVGLVWKPTFRGIWPFSQGGYPA